MPRLTFILDHERHRKLKSAVADRGENISKVLRRAIDEYLAETEKPQEKPKWTAAWAREHNKK
jgi:hypothetical protein